MATTKDKLALESEISKLNEERGKQQKLRSRPVEAAHAPVEGDFTMKPNPPLTPMISPPAAAPEGFAANGR